MGGAKPKDASTASELETSTVLLVEPTGKTWRVGSIISGTGVSIPERVVTNDDLARIMDTSDTWIFTRTGVRERHFAEPGVGASHLAAEAGHAALEDAGLVASDVDMLITATMTPDSLAPGISALVQERMGLGNVAAYDLRQQCSGFVYGLELGDALLDTGRATTALVIGAEVHAGFLPFGQSWKHLLDETSAPPTPEQHARNTRYRSWSVLFGDGAGAVVMHNGGRDDEGFLETSLHSDGSLFDLIQVPGIGSSFQPYVDSGQLEAELHMPTMRGRDLFRRAVTLMPKVVNEVVEEAGYTLHDLDVVVAHQANARIVEGARKVLDLDKEVVPTNIDRYGNTTAATLPILFHELRAAGRVRPGSLVCFTAFGAGAHWGAALYREPSASNSARS